MSLRLTVLAIIRLLAVVKVRPPVLAVLVAKAMPFGWVLT